MASAPEAKVLQGPSALPNGWQTVQHRSMGVFPMTTARRSLSQSGILGKSRIVVALVYLTLVLCACGSDTDTAADGSDAEPLTVSEVFDSNPEGAIQVRGLLFDDGTGLVLCEALAESFPPQCPGLSLPIANPEDVQAEFTVEGAVRWTDRPVTVDGVFVNGRFEISS